LNVRHEAEEKESSADKKTRVSEPVITERRRRMSGEERQREAGRRKQTDKSRHE
jgi:hypothetical protein